MCGIVAAFGNLTYSHEKAFKDMLVFDQVRGEHSTGAAFIGRTSNTPKVAKQVGTPDNLFYTKEWSEGMAQANRAIIGHNRYATVGKINAENAHPFTRGAVTGVHNGSLRGYAKLDGYGKFDVDSEILYNHIDQHGLRDALQNTYGAMALVWWNEDTSTINFYRNADRPLHYALTTDGRVAFIASEPWMIDVACKRQKTPIDIGKIQEVPIHALYTVSLPLGAYNPIDKPTVVAVESRKEPVQSVFTYGAYRGATYYPSNTTVQGSPKSNVVTLPNKQNVIELPEVAEGVYYSDEMMHDYQWAVFYENSNASAREFIMPRERAMALGLKNGDIVRFECSGLLNYKLKGANNISTFYKINSMADSFKKIASEWGTCDADGKLITDAPFDEEESLETQLIDVDGKSIETTKWYTKYSNGCSYCSSDINHTDRFKYTRNGGILCEDCADNVQLCDALGV